ncbi:hypothetical protein ACFL6R_03135 [Gemmatimonadota bacterium]
MSGLVPVPAIMEMEEYSVPAAGAPIDLWLNANEGGLHSPRPAGRSGPGRSGDRAAVPG